ncbi:hypothetical protein BT69DRAFT_1343903 [Atractiella rhizophila]|nr:hypothetical protein BT69DRAFT_1343903 [Atractiella rhizophila]
MLCLPRAIEQFQQNQLSNTTHRLACPRKAPTPQEGGKANSGPGKGGELRVEFAPTSTRLPTAPQNQHSMSANKGGIMRNSQRLSTKATEEEGSPVHTSLT